MIWSKVKQRFEAMLAPALRGRVQVHLTSYERTSRFDVGRGWITLDGVEVVSVQVPSFYSNNIGFDTRTLDFGKALYSYPDLAIEAALASEDALISGLAFLDGRCGKRRLLATDAQALHKFAHILYELRCTTEGLVRKAAPPAA